MKCDYCGKNEATSRFIMNYMGNTGEIHLCEECLNGFQRYAAGMTGSWPAPAMSGIAFGEGLSPSQENTRVLVREREENQFPADAGEEIKQRRKLAELRARLAAAVELEDYESAARFRDELFRAEKE